MRRRGRFGEAGGVFFLELGDLGSILVLFLIIYVIKDMNFFGVVFFIYKMVLVMFICWDWDVD